MNFTEPRGHVGVEASNEGDAGGAAHPGGADAGDGEAEHEGEGDGDPRKVDAGGHVSNSLHDALENVDVFADRDEECDSRADVESAGEKSSPGDCAGKSTARILNFVAHDGGEFEADETEANYAE